MLNRINTNDMLQVRRPLKAISPYIRVMCGASSKSTPHLILHCSMADFLWNALFGIFGECWVCPKALDQFLLTSFTGFGRRKEAKSLLQYTVYVWCIWLERNSCNFNGKYSDKHVLWIRIWHWAFTWCKMHDLFRGVSLKYAQRLECFTLLMSSLVSCCFL